MEMALDDSELDRIGRQTMQTTIAVEDIKVSVAELLQTLQPGDEVILTKGELPVAKLVSEAPNPALKLRPGPGLCKGSILYMAPDFDAPLEEMKEYME